MEQNLTQFFQNDELIKRIERLPEQIKQKEIELMEDKDLLEENMLVIRSSEQTVKGDVEREVNPETQKPMFSNEAKRMAETYRRLSIDSSYQILTDQIKTLQKKISINTIEVGFLKKKFWGAVAIVGGNRD